MEAIGWAALHSIVPVCLPDHEKSQSIPIVTQRYSSLSLRAVLLCLVGLSAPVVHAQIQADTVRSFMSFRVAEDTLNRAVLTAHHDITSSLTQIPGSFVYDFNTFAWPAAWSIHGLSPQSVQLYFGAIPFDDLLTGRSRYDLLPTALLRSAEVNPGLPGGITGIQTELRTIDTSRPHTQLHYQAGDHKLQRVTALHAQQRNRLFDQPGRLQGLFAYGGASDAGDYPGSRLQRQRQLLLRTRYQRTAWSLELLYLHNQRRLGAHSGVLGAEDTRYNRLIAGVIGERQTRRTVRNDVLATLKTQVLTASMYLTTQSGRYAGVGASARRFGGSLLRDFKFDRNRLRVRMDAYTQRIPKGSALPEGHQASLVEIQLGDSLQLQSSYLFAQAGLRNQTGDWSPRGRLQWGASISVFDPYVEISYSAGSAVVPGWGDYLINKGTGAGRVLQAHTGIGLRMGRLTLMPYGFVSDARDVPDYREITVDSVQLAQDTYTALGAGIRLYLAAEPDRGVYAAVNSGVTEMGRTSDNAKRILPQWALSGRLGFRTVLFTGDLRLDVSVRGRSWSAMTSRTLHAPTGLLVIPSGERSPVSASYTLDLVVEGGIRTATVYILYENMTSGTGLMTGNELVADYPLPAGQLRFGVYWPITN